MYASDIEEVGHKVSIVRSNAQVDETSKKCIYLVSRFEA